MDHRANDIMEYPFDTFTVPTHRLFLLPCTLLVPTYIHILSPIFEMECDGGAKIYVWVVEECVCERERVLRLSWP